MGQFFYESQIGTACDLMLALSKLFINGIVRFFVDVLIFLIPILSEILQS